MASLTESINGPTGDVFRRMEIKRRLRTTGKYETGWQDLTKFVKRWGTLDMSVDDVRLNRFRFSGVNLTCRNDEGTFNDETNASSAWNGFMTRYRTLVRIQAGYEVDGAELPTDPTQGIFILTDEIEKAASTNQIVLRCSSLQSVFDEVRATEVPGLGSTQSASDILAKIRDHSDGAGNDIFREFITSTLWTIQTTTNNYFLQSASSLDGLTCWQLMQKLAEAEGFVLLLNRFGGIEFTDRESRTTTSQFSFLGQGFNRQNIIRFDGEKESLDKLFTRFRMKHLEADTSTSYVEAGTSTTVDADNLAWRYGQRIYEFENRFASDTATAQTIVDNLQSEFGTVKQEIKFDARFHPELQALDRIDVSYRSYDVAFTSLWDVMVWDEDLWSIEGQNFDYDGREFNILSRRINLDNFAMTVKAREV